MGAGQGSFFLNGVWLGAGAGLLWSFCPRQGQYGVVQGCPEEAKDVANTREGRAQKQRE